MGRLHTASVGAPHEEWAGGAARATGAHGRRAGTLQAGRGGGAGVMTRGCGRRVGAGNGAVHRPRWGQRRRCSR
eukprot:4972215-Prymnesium_polylepis.1